MDYKTDTNKFDSKGSIWFIFKVSLICLCDESEDKTVHFYTSATVNAFRFALKMFTKVYIRFYHALVACNQACAC